MTAGICIALYALGLTLALRGELAVRQRLARMARDLRAKHMGEVPHA